MNFDDCFEVQKIDPDFKKHIINFEKFKKTFINKILKACKEIDLDKKIAFDNLLSHLQNKIIK
jgi:hypothetical protein